MKNKLLIILVFGLNSLFAQSAKTDTLTIIYDRFSSVQDVNFNYLVFNSVNDALFLKYNKHMVAEDFNQTALIQHLWHDNPYVYCRFFDKRNYHLIEEGNWDLCTFHGSYRSFYKNGKLKSEGNYFMGIEVGKWIYYKKDGTVYKVVLYPADCYGVYDRKKGRSDINALLEFGIYRFQTPQDSINFVNSVKGRWIKRYR